MSTIVTRVGKGSPLTYVEMDANLTNLNTDKLESAALAPYETTAHAAATYAPISTTETIAHAAATYITPAAVAATYAPISTTETISSAAATYATKISPTTSGTFSHSGNVGFAVTPNAGWASANSTATGLQFQGSTAVWNSTTDGIGLSSNLYNSGTGFYRISTGVASLIRTTPTYFKAEVHSSGTGGAVLSGGTILSSFLLSSTACEIVAPSAVSVPSGLDCNNTIHTTGSILANSGIGYGSGLGSGSTVTQLTSRATGVTIDHPTGSITMFTAAGSVTANSFVVTNGFVGLYDTVILSVRGASNKYVTSVSNVAAGSFTITFYSATGVASDTPIINFSVLKGSID